MTQNAKPRHGEAPDDTVLACEAPDDTVLALIHRNAFRGRATRPAAARPARPAATRPGPLEADENKPESFAQLWDSDNE